jgi:hypothetical protein
VVRLGHILLGPAELGMNLKLGRYTRQDRGRPQTNWPWPIGALSGINPHEESGERLAARAPAARRCNDRTSPAGLRKRDLILAWGQGDKHGQ